MTRNVAKINQTQQLYDAHQMPISPRRSYDRRTQSRRYFETPVRYMTEEGGEYEGVLQDISPEGVRVIAQKPPVLGDKVILYIDKVGRFEGCVVRSEAAEFALKMTMNDAKMRRLEKAIVAFFQMEASDATVSDRRENISDRRSYDRRSVDLDEICGVTANGASFQCRIANLSLGGAEIMTMADLHIDQEITIGIVKGIVTRKTEKGYAVKRVEN